jgi:hypothetical protein
MKTKALALLVLILFVGTPAYAQQDWWFGLSYETSLASGSAADFASGLSWRGAGFSGRRMTSENTSVGFMTGWHVMDDVSRETLDFEAEGFDRSLDLTGDYFRYVNSFPIMLNGHYYTGLPGDTRGYVGANVGVYYIERRVEAGIFVVDDNNWHFGASPEIGIVTPMGWHARGFLGARYNWAASAGGSGSITYWNFFVGVAWM